MAGIRRPASSCGAVTRFPRPARKAARPGRRETHICAAAARPGSPARTIPSSISSTGAPAMPARGMPRGAPGRQSLYRLGAGDQPEDRRDRLALPARAERDVRPRRDLGMDPRGHRRQRHEAQGGDAFLARRISLRDRSHQRRADRGRSRSRKSTGRARRHEDRPSGRIRSLQEACAPASRSNCGRASGAPRTGRTRRSIRRPDCSTRTRCTIRG